MKQRRRLRRLRAAVRRWFRAPNTAWCTYRHHFAPALVTQAKRTHYAHTFCRACFDEWLSGLAR